MVWLSSSMLGDHLDCLLRPPRIHTGTVPGSALSPSCGSSRSLKLLQVYHEEPHGGSTTEPYIEKLQWLFNWNLIQTIITRTIEVQKSPSPFNVYQHLKHKQNRLLLPMHCNGLTDIRYCHPSHKLLQLANHMKAFIHHFVFTRHHCHCINCSNCSDNLLSCSVGSIYTEIK